MTVGDIAKLWAEVNKLREMNHRVPGCEQSIQGLAERLGEVDNRFERIEAQGLAGLQRMTIIETKLKTAEDSRANAWAMIFGIGGLLCGIAGILINLVRG